MNKIGKMHQVKQLHWLLFPDKETAGATATDFPFDDAAGDAAYWSKQLNCNISYISPKDLVVLLEVDGRFKKVLTSNGELGWTWFDNCYRDCFEEVSQ